MGLAWLRRLVTLCITQHPILFCVCCSICQFTCSYVSIIRGFTCDLSASEYKCSTRSTEQHCHRGGEEGVTCQVPPYYHTTVPPYHRTTIPQYQQQVTTSNYLYLQNPVNIFDDRFVSFLPTIKWKVQNCAKSSGNFKSLIKQKEGF